ncbi:MAG: inositol monophosphatase family protein [Acidimicrobiales bacterium]
MPALRPETTAAVAAVREALMLAARGTGAVHPKEGRDVVTDADVAVEDHLRQRLTGVAGWSVVGEERGGDVPQNAPYWIVDPICGTRNFASGIPLFAVNVALVEEGSVAISVVGDGATGDVVVAERGNRAWRVDEAGLGPLSTSSSSLIVDFGAWPRSGPARERGARVLAAAIRADRWDVRCLSTTLALVYVAAGQIAGCVLLASLGLVHVAAGSLLVAEAGGFVTDLAGEPWILDSSSLVASSDERFHEDLLDLVHAAA